jgi:hypothetical protein
MRERDTKKGTEYKPVTPLIFIGSINVSGMSQCLLPTIAADAYVSTMDTA